MKNYVQAGDTVSLPAPYARLSGEGALIGALFGVAVSDVANGATVEWRVKGVFDLAKVGSQAWTAGAAVYWDNTNKYCTTTASGNTLIGHAVAAVANGSGDTVGRVRLS